MGTEFEPLFCLRVVGTPEEGGNIRSSFDYYRVRSSVHNGNEVVPCLICGMMLTLRLSQIHKGRASPRFSYNQNQRPLKYLLPTFFTVPDSGRFTCTGLSCNMSA